jgi:putative deaminase of polymorphic toxin system
MLNQLAKDLEAVKGTVRGELKIISELDFCKSCRGIIKQFNDKFPEIKLVLINGTN